MKYSIFCVLSIFIASQIQAQVAPNFTLVDLNGNSHELYEYLDNNKVVILDFYAEWCDPCQQNAAGVEAIWEAYGPDGTNEVMILGIEADDDSTDEQVAQYAIDWNCNNPQINDTGDVPDMYGIEYYPTYYVVCPDRFYHEFSGGPSEIEDILLEGVDACEGYLELVTDARIYEYNSSTVLCSEETTPNITLMNMGTEPLTSATIEVFLNGEIHSTTNWSGALNTFDFEMINFETIDLTGISDPTILIEISDPNGMDDENLDNNSMEVEVSYGGVNYESENIRFELAFDNFPQETDWEFLNSVGEVVASGSNYVGFPDFSPPIDMIIDLDPNDCFTFNIYDSAGDGICCTYADPGEGFWRISTDDDVLIAEGGTFTNQESALFGLTGDVGIEDEELNNFIIYPNPASSQITIQCESNNFNWEIISLDGRVVKNGNSENTNTLNISLESLNSFGTYLIKLESDNKTSYSKFVYR